MAFDPVKVKQVLNSFGEKVVAKSKENLNNPSRISGNKITTSGNLESKIKFVAAVMPNSMSLKFDLGEYGQGIDQGINGAGYKVESASRSNFRFKSEVPGRGMVNNIQSWILQKGITTDTLDTRRAAFGIAQHVLRYGISPTYFFRDAYDEHFATLDTEIMEAFGLDLDGFFEFIFKQ